MLYESILKHLCKLHKIKFFFIKYTFVTIRFNIKKKHIGFKIILRDKRSLNSKINFIYRLRKLKKNIHMYYILTLREFFWKIIKMMSWTVHVSILPQWFLVNDRYFNYNQFEPIIYFFWNYKKIKPIDDY